MASLVRRRSRFSKSAAITRGTTSRPTKAKAAPSTGRTPAAGRVPKKRPVLGRALSPPPRRESPRSDKPQTGLAFPAERRINRRHPVHQPDRAGRADLQAATATRTPLLIHLRHQSYHLAAILSYTSANAREAGPPACYQPIEIVPPGHFGDVPKSEVVQGAGSTLTPWELFGSTRLPGRRGFTGRIWLPSPGRPGAG